MNAAAGAPVIAVHLDGLGDELYHLPAPTRRNGRGTVAFDPDSCPADWPTLCRLEGAVYGYGGAMLRRRLCAVCEARAAPGTLVREPKPGAKRRGKPPMKWGKLTEVQVRALHLLHWEQRVPINEIARRYWQRFGYASHGACATSLSRFFKQLALPTHDRIEMTVAASTTHGMKRRNGNSAAYKRFRAAQRGDQYDAPCTATNQAGKPCRVRAMLGKTTCQFHDPDRHAAWQQHMAKMRAEHPLHDPDRLEPLPPLQAEMVACFTWCGGWQPLAVETGMARSWLSRLAKTKQQQRVACETAALIRSAIGRLQPAEAIAA